MNTEFELARFLLYGVLVLLGTVRLGVWCYALYRTRLWFILLLAISALLHISFGVISMAILWDLRAWIAMLGRTGLTMFYNALFCGQVIGGVIEAVGVTCLVVWLCRSYRRAAPPNTALEPTSAAR